LGGVRQILEQHDALRQAGAVELCVDQALDQRAELGVTDCGRGTKRVGCC
jgi:hypothetical protein